MNREVKRLRCAIYTRVSTEHGLEQDFNSLDAQREAAEAYIKSQAHEGWVLIKAHYDDGGFSGGSMDRPALQRLLSDVQAGSVDVVVVYKVDRLTRALRDLFEAVQQALSSQHRASARARGRSGALLMGRLYDDAGNRMTPAHANKRGVRYRYYVSAALSQGRPAGSVTRVSAREIDAAVLRALRERYPDRDALDDRAVITGSVDRIVLRDAALDISLLIDTESAIDAVDDPDDEGNSSAPAPALTVSWKRPAARRRREIIVSNGSEDGRPIRAETRATLVRSIAVGRSWLQEIVEGSSAGPDEIAARESCSRRHVMMMISLAFLAPDLVTAAMHGRLPRGIGVTRLIDAPIEWSRQWHMLGLGH